VLVGGILEWHPVETSISDFFDPTVDLNAGERW
jgi:hypothetical protein